MDIVDYILIALGIALILYIIVLYNNLVALKRNTNKSWSNIDVLLKQRHDELPKLVETCKQYMTYEKTTLENITKARNLVNQARAAGDIEGLGKAETFLRSQLGNLFALAEDYPELKANDAYNHLQSRISGLENAIADRREYYNETATLNNIRIEQFPDVLVAKLFAFRAFSLLEFSDQEKKDVNISSLFSGT